MNTSDPVPPGLDAVLVLSFGGPDGPDDVMPFLEQVTRGRPVPPARLEVVAEQYLSRGGISPINAQNIELVEALRAELARRGVDLPVDWGNRNWHPFVDDTARRLAAAGARSVAVIATSAFGSYSGCRQYCEDLDRATTATDGAVEFRKLGLYWNHPGFLEAAVDRITDAIARVDADRLHADRARLVFTAHSIPTAWTASDPYLDQLTEAAAHLAVRAAPGIDHDLVFQSRSGPPQIPWLEPDVADHLESLAEEGIDTVVVFPLGFVSDHMEVVVDLDAIAAQRAEELGLTMVRAATVGTHPAFVGALADLVERARDHGPGHPERLIAAIGVPWGDPCPARCCVH